jgi:hypothetical protein
MKRRRQRTVGEGKDREDEGEERLEIERGYRS